MKEIIVKEDRGNGLYMENRVLVDNDNLDALVTYLENPEKLDYLWISEDSGATFIKASVWICKKYGEVTEKRMADWYEEAANKTKDDSGLFCTATRNLQNDYYEQQLEEEAENEGMIKAYIDSGFTSGVGSDFTCPQGGDFTKVSSVDDSFTWEEYEEWVKMGKTTGNLDKKDHSKFIQQVKDNELSKDDIVKYLEENL